MKGSEVMKTYEFTLIVSEIENELAEQLYGICNDASLGKRHGVTYVAFDRESLSLEAAINSAFTDLTSIGIEPVRVEMAVPLVAA